MTLCNMTVEAGARAALIAPDATTFEYVRAHTPSLDDTAWPAALEDWRELHSDVGAHFDAEHRFDARNIAPFVTWGTSPDQASAIDQPIPDEAAQATPEAAASLRRALDYMGLTANQPIPARASTGFSLARARTGASKTCARWPRSCAAGA